MKIVNKLTGYVTVDSVKKRPTTIMLATYKSLRFFRVMQQLTRDWISDQGTKLVCQLSRNLQIKTNVRSCIKMPMNGDGKEDVESLKMRDKSVEESP